jgi:hypothetical protein
MCDIGGKLKSYFKLAKGFNMQMEIDKFYDVYEEKCGHNFPK